MLITINRLKGEMLALQRNFSHMFMRVNATYLAGEPLSIFQLGERRRKKTVITQLRTEENEIVVEPPAIEANLLNFFSSLYTEEAANNNNDGFECDRVIPPDDPTKPARTKSPPQKSSLRSKRVP
nr:uncharacterized protein LOC115270193 [Aedes albopictus]